LFGNQAMVMVAGSLADEDEDEAEFVPHPVKRDANSSTPINTSETFFT
jgi:hypothetical protein